MNRFTASIRGCLRTAFLRSGGIAFANAWRTILRCIPCFRDSPAIVSPSAYSRRSCSNISILALLSIPKACQTRLQMAIGGGPNQMSKVGQM